MIKCQWTGKSFLSRAEHLEYLCKNESAITAAKMAISEKKADACGLTWTPALNGLVQKAVGSAKKEAPDNIGPGSYVFPVINTTNILDSHDDLHVEGLWQNPEEKMMLVTDHEIKVDNIISFPGEVEVMVKDLNWSDLGMKFEGQTQALIFKSYLSELSNQKAVQIYSTGKEIQHSIRMQYVELKFAANYEDAGEQAKKNWAEYSQFVVNKEALEQGYLWAVTKANMVMEGSMVPLGSNFATPATYEEPKGVYESQDILSKLKEIESLSLKFNN